MSPRKQAPSAQSETTHNLDQKRVEQVERVGNPFPKAFFQTTPQECARELIGACFIWNGVSCRIVETEAYDAQDDPACHTFRRPSAREFVATRAPGTAYVYLNYGVHWLVNVLIKGGEREGFVLFRAVDLPEGRGAGPGRLTKALGITGKDHGRDLCEDPACGLRAPGGEKPPIRVSPRIGISLGQDLLWRYFWAGHPAVSGPKALNGPQWAETLKSRTAATAGLRGR
jgi:DNA-3-methyladenine glycosylase